LGTSGVEPPVLEGLEPPSGSILIPQDGAPGRRGSRPGHFPWTIIPELNPISGHWRCPILARRRPFTFLAFLSWDAWLTWTRSVRAPGSA
jgi:hypothetical protein